MPGLLRGIARTAAIAGTATAVSGRVQRRQAERYAGRDADVYATGEVAYAEPAPLPGPPSVPTEGDSGDPTINQLKELAALRAQGVLTEDEFAAQKARILST